MANKPQCFVIQGFGQKTDYTNGRSLNLDASYSIIKMAVEAAGMECVRADEIVHSGTIDVPMYERLLNADLVIADLSTYNVNAAYELGVRYALKPYATIVLAEDQFKNPFDVSHVAITRYKHLGEEIGFGEANRLMALLRDKIKIIMANKTPDSPVYTYIPELKPPQAGTALMHDLSDLITDVIGAGKTAIQEQINIEVDSLINTPSASASNDKSQTPNQIVQIMGDTNPNTKLLLDKALENINRDDFGTACVLLHEINRLRPNDTFVLQQQALATYKNEQIPVQDRLKQAKTILQNLSPETTNNPETLGLWGSLHKRFWEENHDLNDLDEAINAHERGFYMKQDNYNGINLAFLLNVRALEKMKAGEREEANADFIIAKRVRQDVIKYAVRLLETLSAEEKTIPENEQVGEFLKRKFWVLATLGEAAIGRGDEAAYSHWDQAAQSLPVAAWMQKSRHDQGTKLRCLLNDYKTVANERAS